MILKKLKEERKQKKKEKKFISGNSKSKKLKSRLIYSYKDNKPARVELTPEFMDPGSTSASDNEADFNRIGNVPLDWYNSLKHIGYTSEGKKIKKNIEAPDLRKLLNDPNDSDAWRNLVDVKNQHVYRLTDEDIEIIKRVQSKKFPDSTFDPYGPDSYVEFDNPEEAIHPTIDKPVPKRRFLPSKHEVKKVLHYLKLIKQGKLTFSQPLPPQVYDLWGKNIFTYSETDKIKGPPSIPAPKMTLPGHGESYNTPDEFMFDEEEKKAWDENEDNLKGVEPKQYDCLRHVPAYSNLLKERFERCLDLYLCSRSIKMKMNVDPACLLPPLPTIENLKPFPSKLSVTFESGDSYSAPNSLCFDPKGTCLAVGRKNGVLEIFDVSSSRLICNYKSVESPITCVQFNPVYPFISYTQENFVYFIYLKTSSVMTSEAEETLNNILQINSDANDDAWEKISSLNDKNNSCIGWKVNLHATATNVVWHKKGLYAATVCRYATSPSNQLALHSIRKTKTIHPIRFNLDGKITAVQFHPSKNLLYIAPQKNVRLYDLTKSTSGSKGGKLVTKFTGIDSIESLAVHPSGEVFAVGGNNHRLTFYDSDLGQKPYKVLSFVQVFHIAVDLDMLSPPTIIPVNKINISKAFEEPKMQGVISCTWHPKQAWLAAGISSGHIGLFV